METCQGLITKPNVDSASRKVMAHLSWQFLELVYVFIIMCLVYVLRATARWTSRNSKVKLNLIGTNEKNIYFTAPRDMRFPHNDFENRTKNIFFLIFFIGALWEVDLTSHDHSHGQRLRSECPRKKRHW